MPLLILVDPGRRGSWLDASDGAGEGGWNVCDGRWKAWTEPVKGAEVPLCIVGASKG